jgi:hypothetical protein
LALELPLAGSGDARPGAGQAEADAGLGDDLDEAGAAAGQMLGHPVVQVLGPTGVVAGVLIALVEVEQIHGARGCRRAAVSEVEVEGVVGLRSAVTAGLLPGKVR